MKTKFLKSILSVSLAAACLPASAGQFKWGDPESQAGQFSVSGFLRAKYQDKSWSDNDHKLSFDTARVNLEYKSPNWFGYAEYRCYQFEKLCDFSTLTDAYVGYKINDQHQIQAGLQPIPFGPGRFWESNYYGGVITQIGLEDVHNLGVKYQAKFDQGSKLELSYFSGDGGAYSGPYSDDASRYTTNFVKPEDPNISHLDEQNMWIARFTQELQGLPQGVSSSLGASYWYSDIENKSFNREGDRTAWAVFGNLGYHDWTFGLTVGQNDVDNQDPRNSKASLMGSFDDNFMVANKGTFYTADVSYTFKEVGPMDMISPYAMYSLYDKSESGYRDSSRHLIGVAGYYKDITLVAEYIMGKNDFLIGGPVDSYAEGSDSKTHKQVNLQIYYHF